MSGRPLTASCFLHLSCCGSLLGRPMGYAPAQTLSVSGGHQGDLGVVETCRLPRGGGKTARGVVPHRSPWGSGRAMRSRLTEAWMRSGNVQIVEGCLTAPHKHREAGGMGRPPMHLHPLVCRSRLVSSRFFEFFLEIRRRGAKSLVAHGFITMHSLDSHVDEEPSPHHMEGFSTRRCGNGASSLDQHGSLASSTADHEEQE